MIARARECEARSPRPRRRLARRLARRRLRIGVVIIQQSASRANVASWHIANVTSPIVHRSPPSQRARELNLGPVRQAERVEIAVAHRAQRDEIDLLSRERRLVRGQIQPSQQRVHARVSSSLRFRDARPFPEERVSQISGRARRPRVRVRRLDAVAAPRQPPPQIPRADVARRSSALDRSTQVLRRVRGRRRAVAASVARGRAIFIEEFREEFGENGTPRMAPTFARAAPASAGRAIESTRRGGTLYRTARARTRCRRRVGASTASRRAAGCEVTLLAGEASTRAEIDASPTRARAATRRG